MGRIERAHMPHKVTTTALMDELSVSVKYIVLFAAVGAGFTAGANLWRWAY